MHPHDLLFCKLGQPPILIHVDDNFVFKWVQYCNVYYQQLTYIYINACKLCTNIDINNHNSRMGKTVFTLHIQSHAKSTCMLTIFFTIYFCIWNN